MIINNRYRVVAGLVAITVLSGCIGNNSSQPEPIQGAPDVEVKVGEPMPLWQKGTLEIHSISTGRGESNFYILPDGTSMLVDAAGSLLTQEMADRDGVGGVTPARPSWDISSAKVIADYVAHFNPRHENLDYFMITHFHGDHLGDLASGYPEWKDMVRHSSGKFYINGAAGVGSLLNVAKVIDRNYTIPTNLGINDRVQEYQRFLRWTIDNRGTKWETIRVGSNDQITLKYEPKAYPGFNLRILCASGYAWTGEGTKSRRTVPLTQSELTGNEPDENIYSIAFQIDYGKFNLFAGGDLQYQNPGGNYAWHNGEAGIIDVATPVEVMKAGHHGSSNSNSAELLSKLNPKTVWINPGRSEQPGMPAMRRFVAQNPNVEFFCTGMHEPSKAPLAEIAQNFKSWEGHIVIRVHNDGKYYVYVLDDTDQRYIVKSIHGPYLSE